MCSNRGMRRQLLFVFTVSLLALVPAGAAFAHAGFTPDEVGPGLQISLTLTAADERDGAAIVEVELVFPEDVTVPLVEAPPVAGWTAAATDRGVSWRASTPVDGDVRLPVVIGPVPDTPGRLQFRVLQTYDDGDVDRWIEDWPAGGPEPEMPGPVLDVVEGGPGSPPPPTSATTATTAAATSTTAGSTTSSGAPTTVAGEAAAAADDDEGADLGPVFAVVGAAVVIAGLGAYFTRRARRD